MVMRDVDKNVIYMADYSYVSQKFLLLLKMVNGSN